MVLRRLVGNEKYETHIFLWVQHTVGYLKE